MNTKFFRQGLAVVFIVVCMTGLVYAHLRLRIYAQDDAYIHFRIVRNWVEYGVPYYNPSERVMATSSVGWTIVLYGIAQASRLFRIADLPTWTAVFNVTVTGLGALVYLSLLRRISATPLRVFVLIFFVVTYLSQIIKTSLGLMETPLAILMTGLGLLGLMTGKPYSMIIFGVIPFFRLELVVVSGLAIVYALVVRHWSLKTLGYLILGALPFLLFDIIFFNQIIPNTMRAKSIIYSLSYLDVVSQVARKNVDDISLLGHFYPFTTTLGLVYAFYSLLVLASWIAIVTYREIRRLIRKSWIEVDFAALFFAVWCMTVLLAYILAQTLLFPWYIPLYVIPGLLVISHTLSTSYQKLLSLIITPFLLVQTLGLIQLPLAVAVSPIYYQDFGMGVRARQYLDVGRKLYACYPQARLMTSEIGGLGYEFRGYILDGVGLVTPEALPYHPLSIPDERSHGSMGVIAVQFIIDKNPEIIVSYDALIDKFTDNPAAERYILINLPLLTEEDLKITGRVVILNSTALNLFIRRDLVEQAGLYCPALGVLP